MESLRQDFKKYIQEYLSENDAIDFERIVWEKFSKNNDSEEIYKIQMKSYLNGLENKLIDIEFIKKPHTIHDITT
jgi:hypothetical protein